MSDVTPSGQCFCGCGGAARPGRFFVQTHDRIAETAVIREKYGSIAAFVVAHGYGPQAPVPTKPVKRPADPAAARRAPAS